jgi:hypothetical protein
LFASLLAGALHFAWRSDRLGALDASRWIAALLTLPLPWMWHVWHRWGERGLISLIVLSKIGDIAGYYVGNAIGKHHPFPSISPARRSRAVWARSRPEPRRVAALVACGLLPHGSWGRWRPARGCGDQPRAPRPATCARAGSSARLA